MIRIGTIEYKNGKKIFPSYPNFKRIEVMTPSTSYGSLGPYVLTNDKGHIMENIWQFIRDNWLSNRIFKSYDEIVALCCQAWNKLIDQPWKIMSIGHRKWAVSSN